MAARRRALLGVVLVAVATSVATGSGGVFATADRRADLDVAAADEAYLGVEAWSVTRNTTGNGSAGSALAVRVENRVGGDTTLVVVAEAGDGPPARVELRPGGVETVRFWGADCGTALSVRATSADGGLSVGLDRRRPCDG